MPEPPSWQDAGEELDRSDKQRQRCAVAEYLAALGERADPNLDRKVQKVISPSDPASASMAKVNNIMTRTSAPMYRLLAYGFLKFWKRPHIYIFGAGGMIRYRYKKPKILFVGINPHPGSFRRGVPFSNNKMFWYLLSDAGLLRETKNELRDDVFLRRLYNEAFNPLYRLGFVNIIDRPTRDITEIKKGEEISGRAKIFRIIKTEKPKIVCFIGKVAYEKYTGLKSFPFGWKDPIALSRVFVMHFPLRGEAVVRIRELRIIKRAAEQ